MLTTKKTFQTKFLSTLLILALVSTMILAPTALAAGFGGSSITTAVAAGKRVTLNVDRKNPVSYHLYRSLGFERMFSQGEFRRVDNRPES